MHCFREDSSKRRSNLSEVFKKKEREKGKIHKAEPARMERGIMKPSKLLQSHRAFFFISVFLLQFFADFNAKLCWNAFGA